MTTSKARMHFRALIAAGRSLTAPFVWDPLSALLSQTVGCPAVYMSGAATAHARGFPDIGVVTQSEMADVARAICGRVTVPVIVDADNGYGEGPHVMRTVADFEAAGVSALHLDDQEVPKTPKGSAARIITEEKMMRKIAAAVVARSDPDLVLIGRSDAAPTRGLEFAIDRLRSYVDAGCDMVFIPDLSSVHELDRYCVALEGIPKVHYTNVPMSETELRQRGIALQLDNRTYVAAWEAVLRAAADVSGQPVGPLSESVKRAVRFGDGPEGTSSSG